MAWTLAQVEAMSNEEACIRLGIAVGHCTLYRADNSVIAYDDPDLDQWRRFLKHLLGIEPWPSHFWPVYANFGVLDEAYEEAGQTRDGSLGWRAAVNWLLWRLANPEA